jgi:hypothetical protein
MYYKSSITFMQRQLQWVSQRNAAGIVNVGTKRIYIISKKERISSNHR